MHHVAHLGDIVRLPVPRRQLLDELAQRVYLADDVAAQHGTEGGLVDVLGGRPATLAVERVGVAVCHILPIRVGGGFRVALRLLADDIVSQGLVPQANITRAEFAQLYFNIIQSYIAKSGSYTKDYKGNLLVRTKDVELKDMSIDGDLIIGNGVADGKVTLSNVKISGRLVVWGGGTAAVYCNDGTTAAEVIACRVDGPVKIIFDRESTLLVYDKIKTRITERAGKFPETEIVFYVMDDLLNAQRDLNKMVDENLIQAEIPAHLYAIVGEQTVSATLKNSSKTDSYTIEIRRDSDGSLIADPVTLAAGASVSSITLKEAPEYGNAACTATITATRDGKTVGTLEVKTALHAAYLWPKEVMSK